MANNTTDLVPWQDKKEKINNIPFIWNIDELVNILQDKENWLLAISILRFISQHHNTWSEIDDAFWELYENLLQAVIATWINIDDYFYFKEAKQLWEEIELLKHKMDTILQNDTARHCYDIYNNSKAWEKVPPWTREKTMDVLKQYFNYEKEYEKKKKIYDDMKAWTYSKKSNNKKNNEKDNGSNENENKNTYNYKERSFNEQWYDVNMMPKSVMSDDMKLQKANSSILNAMSGDIKLKGDNNGNISTMSGDIKLANNFGNINAKSWDISMLDNYWNVKVSSWDIELDWFNWINGVLETSAGDISLISNFWIIKTNWWDINIEGIELKIELIWWSLTRWNNIIIINGVNMSWWSNNGWWLKCKITLKDKLIGDYKIENDVQTLKIVDQEITLSRNGINVKFVWNIIKWSYPIKK